MSDLKLLAQTMREFSDTVGDHHWQAGCAIEHLTAENEALKSAVALAIDTFEQYQMDVDTYPTIKHVALMQNLSGVLAAHDAEVIERAAGIVHKVFDDAQFVDGLCLDAMEALEYYANQLRQQAKDSGND